MSHSRKSGSGGLFVSFSSGSEEAWRIRVLEWGDVEIQEASVRWRGTGGTRNGCSGRDCPIVYFCEWEVVVSELGAGGHRGMELMMSNSKTTQEVSACNAIQCPSAVEGPLLIRSPSSSAAAEDEEHTCCSWTGGKWLVAGKQEQKYSNLHCYE